MQTCFLKSVIIFVGLHRKLHFDLVNITTDLLCIYKGMGEGVSEVSMIIFVSLHSMVDCELLIFTTIILISVCVDHKNLVRRFDEKQKEHLFGCS